MVAKIVAYQSGQYTALPQFVGEVADQVQVKGLVLHNSTKSHPKYDKCLFVAIITRAKIPMSRSLRPSGRSQCTALLMLLSGVTTSLPAYAAGGCETDATWKPTTESFVLSRWDYLHGTWFLLQFFYNLVDRHQLVDAKSATPGLT
jgi:hypothetical protein